MNIYKRLYFLRKTRL